MSIRFCKTIAIIAATITPLACSKKEGDVSESTPRSTAPAAANTTNQANTPESTDTPATTSPFVHSIPKWVDDRLAPSVWLAVNDSTEPEVPKGWPMIVTATVLGAKDAPTESSIDDVALEITDAAGAKAAWPLQRVSKETKLNVGETKGADVTWLINDTSGLAPGTYRVSATLKGGTSNAIPLNIVAAPTTMPAEEEAHKFSLEVKTALWKGDNETALKIVSARIAAHANEMLAYDLQGDALAALSKNKEAADAYQRAFRLFTIQNPKSPEVPAHLAAKIKALSTTATSSQP